MSEKRVFGPEIAVWADGACEPNPGPCAYGVLIVKDGKHFVLGEHLGHGTNNIAEYRGLIAALQWLAENAPDRAARIRVDSQLVAFRLNGSWKKQHSGVPHIQALIEEARALLARLPCVRIEWVRREKNAAADEIAGRFLRREM